MHHTTPSFLTSFFLPEFFSFDGIKMNTNALEATLMCRTHDIKQYKTRPRQKKQELLQQKFLDVKY